MQAPRSRPQSPGHSPPKSAESFLPGQRWVSDSEPELGLGLVLEVGFRDVKIRFGAAEETRVYMRRNAPLRRVRLQPGDRARGPQGQFTVRRVEEAGGLLTYHGDSVGLPEKDLLDQMGFSDPDKRLLAGRIGKPREFALRLRTQVFRREMLGSRVRGFGGARVDLLSHQLSIAHEAAARPRLRALLSDEVGLGKTIEAGLIFHRLHATGQIRRVLVAAPSQLVHQWMVEFYRRFHHMFSVLDEDFCRAEEKGDVSKNPFALRQLILCPLDFLAATPRRVEQAMAAGIDLLIVDEAHHLAWAPGNPSPEYAAVEKLAQAAERVLLLTATPVQLGQAGHFARLRLLDPHRFARYEDYVRETKDYESVAALADKLLASEKPLPEVAEGLRRAFPGDKPLGSRLDDYLAARPGSRQVLVDDLVDRHGTGRLMFRNRRQSIGGFPRRVVHPAPLDPAPESVELARALYPDPEKAFPDAPALARFLAGAPAFREPDVAAAGEGEAGELLRRAWRRDPRLAWLTAFLQAHPEDKVLLLCSHKAVVFALQEILPTLTAIPFASFHENLAMTTRDRNAAYFAEAGGARLLLCSEIGSEGRNFQFAHHLVLFDLPLDPSVLEQRIGRLDRIGQTSDIHIHVPYLRGPQEILFRLYHEGLDAFRQSLLGADYFYEVLIGDMLAAARAALAADPGVAAGVVESLVAKAKSIAAEVRDTLDKGRDRLLEINSHKPALSESLIAEIREQDSDPALEEYLEEVFDHFGLDVQETALPRGYFVFPGERMLLDSFPEVPEAGLALTYDREAALAREELAFLTVDHPLARGAVDLVLEDQGGTTGFAVWSNPPHPGGRAPEGWALEAVFLLEATAPSSLHLDRFLPPAPLRVIVGEKGEDLSFLLPALDRAELDQAPAGLLEERHADFSDLMPRLLAAARAQAAAREAEAKQAARVEAEKTLGGERDRLRALRALNPTVSEAEVAAAEAQAKEAERHILAAESRLDAVRLLALGRAAQNFQT